MNKTLAGFFGIKEKVLSAVVVSAAVDVALDAVTEKKATETTAEGTVRQRPTVPADEIEPTVAEAVTGGDTDAPVEATVGEETLEEVDEAPETEELTTAVIEGEEFETPPDVATPGVEMASLPAAELSQIQADAASWNAHKGEFSVLQNWYKNATGAASVGATADAADVAPVKKKSWEKAPWNN